MSDAPTPADRVLRTLADALDAPASADATEARIPVAATVVLVRDAAGGPEVLLIERPDRGSFAGAWVFPGGKLEEVDSVGGGTDEDEARRAGVRETAEETGLTVDPSGLVTVSHWDPPPGAPLRIRTWFFLGAAPAGELDLAVDEAVSSRWVRPAEMLAAHGRGEVTLYPPTWVTLHGLTNHTTVADMLASARVGGIHRFETAARRGADGPLLLWQEDAEYEADPTPGPASLPTDASADTPARHRLDIGELPWIYTRTV